jgi:hypothetical protein
LSTAAGKALGVCVAECYIGGYSTCAGRSNRYKDISMGELDEYLATRQEAFSGGTGQEDLQGIREVDGRQIHPRLYHFSGTVKSRVWGESCVGVQHFDCVGLVNYAIAPYYSGSLPWGIDIPAYRTSGLTKITDPKDLKDGDVIICKGPPKSDYDSHIGMIYQDGDGIWRVVQAASTESGCSDDAEWSKYEARYDRFRMHDKSLK